MSESDKRPGGALPPLDDEAIARLIESAGPRPPIPREDLDAIAAAARTAWNERAGGSDTAEQTRVFPRQATRGGASRAVRMLALAAALAALVMGLRAWITARDGSAPGAATNDVGAPATSDLATIEAASGAASVESAGVEQPLAPGAAVAAGSVLRTREMAGTPSRLAMRLDNGVSLRLDSGTELRLLSTHRLDLLAGAVYVDTDALEVASAVERAPRPAIEIHTPSGVARDLGTRFLVRLGAGAATAPITIAVRTGTVALLHDGLSATVRDGEQLRMNAAGATDLTSTTPYGPDWAWVIEAAPPFEVSGKSIAEILDWVARETGWTVRYESEALAADARSMRVEASRAQAAIRADQAPFLLLPGADLEATLEDGVLAVTRR